LSGPTPRSLVFATDLDTLPLDRVVERRDDHLVVRSPGTPSHYWGNFLLFDDAPVSGDGARWEALFDDAFGGEPRIRHRAFAWDRTDGEAGAAEEEFVARGYDLDESAGLVAAAADVRPHPRENRDVVVRALDPDGDRELWDAVVELQVAGRDAGHAETSYREFVRARLADRCALFRAGRGSWYVAIDPATSAVTASCGIVVVEGRGRYQVVDTALAYRRRGISSRLLVEAARHATDAYGADRFVIAADRNYHALGLYESLGFEPAEDVRGVCLWPRNG